MSEKSFMEASTEIANYVSKIEQCHTKIASLLAEACISRGKSGKTSSLENDISNALRDLSETDQVVVLKKLAVMLVNHNAGTNTSGANKKNNIFANRGFN